MHAWDYTVVLPNRAGELARVSEELGRAKINIEGVCVFEHQGHGIAHFLFTDHDAPRAVFQKLGCTIEAEHEVMIGEVEDRVGILGEHVRRIADAGVNLDVAYLATGTRLVLGARDLVALEKAWPQAVAGRR